MDRGRAGAPGRRGRAGMKATFAVLAVLALVIGLALFVVPRFSGPCVPTSSQDCGCDRDRGGYGLPDEYVEETFTHAGVSSTYRVYDSAVDDTRPVGVLVRLHGDGAYEYDHSPTFVACLAAVAASHNLALVIPRTPSADLTWWTQLSRNADWLQALHREKIRRIDAVDPGNVWWMGYSGGAEMITYGLLPTRGGTVTGGALMVGGGGAPDRGDLSGPVPEERRADLPLIWATGAHDDGSDPAAEFDALGASREGAEFYRGLGFDAVKTDFTREADHFTIDQVNVLHEALSGSD